MEAAHDAIVLDRLMAQAAVLLNFNRGDPRPPIVLTYRADAPYVVMFSNSIGAA